MNEQDLLALLPTDDPKIAILRALRIFDHIRYELTKMYAKYTIILATLHHTHSAGEWLPDQCLTTTTGVFYLKNTQTIDSKQLGEWKIYEL